MSVLPRVNAPLAFAPLNLCKSDFTVLRLYTCALDAVRHNGPYVFVCIPKLWASLNRLAFIAMKDEARAAVPLQRKTKRAGAGEAMNLMMETMINFPLERDH